MESGKIYIVNGPNLNLTGRRQTTIYGNESMEQVVLRIQRAHPDLQLRYYQSNHEGDLIDTLQAIGNETRKRYENETLRYENENDSEKVLGIVLNAGGYSHTSIAIRDTVEWLREQGIPTIEVHISDISKREAFRRTSLLTDVCQETYMGLGTLGYDKAVNTLLHVE